jgi:uncharacterized protein
MNLTRIDGWMNLFTGLGNKNKDKSFASYAQWNKPEEQGLEELYAADDVARTIVDDIVKEGTREWITFVHPNQDVVKAYTNSFDSLDIRGIFRNAWSWSRLHGGAGIWLVTDADSREVLEPLDLEQIGTEGGLKSLVVLSRWELQAQSIDSNPASPTYGLPKTYQINPRFGGASSIEVHASRIVRFDGLPLPRRTFIQNNYWGDSVLNSTQESIKNYNNANLYSVNALSDFSTPVIKMKNLAELFAAGKESLVQSRLHTVNMCRSVLRMMVIDEEESFEYIARNLSSVPEVVEKAAERLVVASKMPRTRVLGDSSKGLNNGGEADERKWYDMVRAEQEAVLTKPLEKVIKALQNTPGFSHQGDPEFSWKFAPLWQESNQQKAANYATVANADAAYIDRGVLDPSQVAQRFEADTFSVDLKLEEEPEEVPMAEDESILKEIRDRGNA